MSVIEKVIERVPYADGGFRRRVTSGLIVLVSIGVSFVSVNNASVNLEFYVKQFSSPTVLILISLLMYATGGLVEVFAELFVTRITGNTVSAYVSTFQSVKKYHFIIRPLAYLIAIYAATIKMYYEWAKALVGKSSYRWESEKELSEHSNNYFESLPSIVKAGFNDPFGEYSELSWKYFSSSETSIEISKYALELRSKNRDMLVITTSIIIALTAISFTVSEGLVLSDSNALQFVYFQLSLIVLVLFLSSYFILVKQSIKTLLEFAAMRSKPNKSSQQDASEAGASA
jgi:uncharacterized integral membrane protein